MTTIGIILLALTAIYFAYKNVKGRRGEKWLADALRQSLADYEALEQGVEEIQQGHEQEYLSFVEKHNEQALIIAELEAYLEKHDRECLPNLDETLWANHHSVFTD